MRSNQWFRVGNLTTFLIVCGRRAAVAAERELRAMGHGNIAIIRDGDPERPKRPAKDEDGPGFKV